MFYLASLRCSNHVSQNNKFTMSLNDCSLPSPYYIYPNKVFYLQRFLPILRRKRYNERG